MDEFVCFLLIGMFWERIKRKGKSKFLCPHKRKAFPPTQRLLVTFDGSLLYGLDWEGRAWALCGRVI